MKIDWSRFNDRERWMLGIAGVFCGLFLLYALIYAPLTGAVQNKWRERIEKQETYAWMQDALQQQKSTHALKKVSTTALLTILARELKTTSFHQMPYHLEQTGGGDIQLSFEAVPYTAVMIWLREMSQTYACAIKQLNIEGTKTPGVVKWMAVLTIH
ncbi:MAG TPA: general secretion pathway protein GspM [Legionella sp.]|nr:general secretion pathway protein GspM [Legionella sp.]